MVIRYSITALNFLLSYPNLFNRMLFLAHFNQLPDNTTNAINFLFEVNNC